MKIRLDNVHVSIGKKNILHQVSGTFPAGNIIGIIGPNGSGKSTLLKTIAKINRHHSGAIYLNDQSTKQLSRKQMAQAMSYVPQDTMVHVDFTVKEIVQMGRHVHQPLFHRHDHKDSFIVEESMRQANCHHLQDMHVHHLSGGQRQLAIIAKALAQDTPILLLDEPIAALDMYYQLHILHMLRRIRESGKTIIIVLHDLNLAARFCDQLLLLHDGQVKAFASVKEVITSDLLASVYGVETELHWNEKIQKIQMIAHLSMEKE